MSFRRKEIIRDFRQVSKLTRDFRTDKICLGGCGGVGSIPISIQDRWGYRYLRGHVCYTCYTEP